MSSYGLICDKSLFHQKEASGLDLTVRTFHEKHVGRVTAHLVA